MAERLVVHYHDRPVQQHWLDRSQRYQVGRDVGCDIRIDDSRVSRSHACLFRTDDCWFLQDNDSKNGTTCRGQQILQTQLPPTGSAWLSLGGLMIHFEHVSGACGARESATATRRRQTTRHMIRQMNPRLGLKPLLQKVLESILSTSGTDRGFVMLKRQDGEMLVVACRELSVSEIQNQSFSGSAGAVDLAVQKRRPVLICDAMEEFALSSRPSIRGGHIRALVCIPLALNECIIGVVYADSSRVGKVFTELDAELLGALAEQAALALNVVWVREEIEALSISLPDDNLTQTAARHSGEAAAQTQVDAATGSNSVPIWSRLHAMHRQPAGAGR